MRYARFLSALKLTAAMVPVVASFPAVANDTHTFLRTAEGYQIDVPALCKVEQAEKRLTATCPARLQPSLVDKSSLDETFVLEIISTPVPSVDLIFPSEQISREMSKVACGPDPAKTSLARVDIAFSIKRWPAFDGFVRCTPSKEPGGDKVFSFMRFAASPRMSFWLYTRASARTKDAAGTTASQTFFLSFRPLPE